MYMRTIFRFLAVALVTAAAVFASDPRAAAQGYPSRHITLVVPLAAGSTADILARLFAEELTRRLGANVVVDNRPNAGGTTAMLQVKDAAPDGYTFSLISQGTHVFNPALNPRLGYDAVRDFTPMVALTYVTNAMIVNPARPFRAPLDVAEAARRDPGNLTYSSGGIGTSHHLSSVLFAHMLSLQMQHVPYRGAPAGIQAVMTDEVAVAFYNIPTVLSQIRSGRLRAIGVTSRARSPLLPEVPTLEEQGIRGYEMVTWMGFAAPPGTPADIVDRLNRELIEISRLQTIRERLGALGFEFMEPVTGERFRDFIRADLERWVPVIRASGATPE
jgi:tripartite-type tricarboxylate transporter receptor subunit TctC